VQKKPPSNGRKRGAAEALSGGAAAHDAGAAGREGPPWNPEWLDALVAAREEGFGQEPGISCRGSWQEGMQRAGVQELLTGWRRAALGNKWTALVAVATKARAGSSSSIKGYKGAGQIKLSADLLQRVRQQEHKEHGGAG
jgi:hypothetical protein